MSILIPIFQVIVVDLVKTLQLQCENLSLDYEILCFDDGSTEDIRQANRQELQHLFRVSYIELSENLGRSKIRNWLAKAANGNKLLYLDSDSAVESPDFIKTYIESPQVPVIYGGRTYTSNPPESEYLLHWRYGREVESKNARKRNQNPYLHFMSNNVLLDASIQKKFPFDESFTGYGYEDLWFAEQLKIAGVPIFHIDNPVIHLGLDSNVTMLRKIQQANENLFLLASKDSTFKTRLIQWYQILKNWAMDVPLIWLFNITKAGLEEKLKTGRIKLWQLQFYKLGLFAMKMKDHK